MEVAKEVHNRHGENSLRVANAVVVSTSAARMQRSSSIASLEVYTRLKFQTANSKYGRCSNGHQSCSSSCGGGGAPGGRNSPSEMHSSALDNQSDIRMLIRYRTYQ